MDFISIIEKKKLGKELSANEIALFAQGAADGSIPDYQLSALLMAIRLNGMTREETVNLTLSMEKSGDVCDLSSLDGIPVDKHSTGGVGDTTTLILAPLVAACGVPVAKMSGRGLGHTGGTLDKLESIPGFSVSLSEEAFLKQVSEIGLAVIGQTGNLAPADKALYALRDVTSTVDSLPLIASSIMSKKLASGSSGIVLDVKTGRGALMKTVEDSIGLARTMVEIGTDAGRRVVAVVSGMDEPLGSHIGNALEVKEAIDVLSGRTKGPLLEVAAYLGAWMLVMGGAAADEKEGEALLMRALESGRGLQKLKEMIIAQGGDPACCDNTELLPFAPVRREVRAQSAGCLQQMDTVAIGNAANHMGAGRRNKDDVIDPGVGFIMQKRIGDEVRKGESLALLFAKDGQSAAQAEEELLSAITIGAGKVAPSKLIDAIVTKDQVIRR